MGDSPRLRVVVSSSPVDAPWRAQLLQHLRVLERFRNVEVWTDAEVEAGANWRAVVDRELGRADVALLLVSSAYLASDHLQDVEVPLLFERHKTGGVQVIPVLVRSCAWDLHPWIGKLLPEGQRPVAAFEGDDRDRAFADVVLEVERIVAARHGARSLSAQPRSELASWRRAERSADGEFQLRIWGLSALSLSGLSQEAPRVDRALADQKNPSPLTLLFSPPARR